MPPPAAASSLRLLPRLIEELLRNTSDSHPDYPHLMKGLDLVSSVAKHINAEMHSAENRNTILRIQGEFSGGTSFVSPSRRFIKQGVMVKKCRSSDKTYEFFLFNDLLAYASKSGIISSGGKYKLHQEIPIVSHKAAAAAEHARIVKRALPRMQPPLIHSLFDCLLIAVACFCFCFCQVDANFSVDDVPSPHLAVTSASAPSEPEQFLFQINNKIKSFIVSVPDLATKTAWLTAFAKIVQDREKQEKQKAEASVSNGSIAGQGQRGSLIFASSRDLLGGGGGGGEGKKAETVAPVWRSDSSQDTCPCCNKKFTFTKRRHHCRKVREEHTLACVTESSRRNSGHSSLFLFALCFSACVVRWSVLQRLLSEAHDHQVHEIGGDARSAARVRSMRGRDHAAACSGRRACHGPGASGDGTASRPARGAAHGSQHP